VLLRPPAILGAGDSSIWNALRPAAIRDGTVRPARTCRTRRSRGCTSTTSSRSPPTSRSRVWLRPRSPATGPVAGACTAVNVAAGPATVRDYYEAVTRAVGVAPVWEDGEAWTGRILADRAHGWGWTPAVRLDEALAELKAGLC
jgi:hypothetical protein